MSVLVRFFSAILVAALCLPASAAWPERPIRILVGNAAGSAPDVFARIYAAKLAQSLAVPVIVENRPGATGNMAQDAVAKASPDGYTLLYAISNSFVTNPYLFEKLPYDHEKDFAPVAPLIAQGLFLVVGDAFPARSVADLVALTRSTPGGVNYASYGNGGFPHLVMALFAEDHKLQMTHVPYKSGAINDVIGGMVPMVIEPAATAVPFVKAGKIRALAYTGPKRHPALPDVPTFSETDPNIVLTAFHAMWAPAGTPPAVVATLNRLLGEASEAADVQSRVRARYCEPIAGTPEQLADRVRRDAAVWSRVIRTQNIKLE